MVPSTFYVRGVSYRGDAVAQVIAAVKRGDRVSFTLVPIEGNPHDAAAIRVDATVEDFESVRSEGSIGWVPRELCVFLREAMKRQGVSQLEAELSRADNDATGAYVAITVSLPNFVPQQASVGRGRAADLG